MNISKVSLMTPSRNFKKLAAAAMLSVGVIAGASAATKVNNKNNNVTPPTNVEETKKEETKKQKNPFEDLLINLAMGTAVIGGAGVLLAKGEKERAEMLNEIFAQHTYRDADGNIVTETKK